MAFSNDIIKKAARKAVSLFKRATTAFDKRKAGQEKAAYRQKTVRRKRILNDEGSITITTQTENQLTITGCANDYPAPLRINRKPFISMSKPEVEMLQLFREQRMSQKAQPSPGKLGEMHEALGSHGMGLGIGCRNIINFEDELFLPISLMGEHLASDGSLQPEYINSSATVRDLCVAASEVDAASVDDDQFCSASNASNQATVGLLFPTTPSYHLKSDGSIGAESIASTSAVRNFRILTPPRLQCRVFESSPADTAHSIDVFSPTWCETGSWTIGNWTRIGGALEEEESRTRACEFDGKESMRVEPKEDSNQAFGWMGGICIA